MVDVSEVASLAVFLASPQAAAITGQAVNICGDRPPAQAAEIGCLTPPVIPK
jgi:NAD(P)-dependent dehydrogenase (short-subunit alcohol dehydrogenase family)